MLFNVFLASIAIILCILFLFRVVFNSFCMILVVKGNTELKFTLAIPTGGTIRLAKEAIVTPPLVSGKKVKA